MGRQARGPDPSLGGSLFDIFRYLGTGTQLGQQNLQGLQDLQGAGYQADIENTKKYGPELQRLRQQQMEADPLIKRLRGVAIGGLQGLQNGQMPADIERSITNRVRQGQLARGIEDSPFSVGQEAAALIGGQEAVRSQRLNQAMMVAQPFNTAGPMLSGGIPSFGDLMNYRMQGLQMQQQQAEGKAAGSQQMFGALGSLAGMGANMFLPGSGSLLSGATGGGGGDPAAYNARYNGSQPFMEESWRFKGSYA